ncbi:hypothetical protein JCM17846_27650 [Iodidimonas nitroreducens]|uniref:Uncharacterized protein n=1 Tax=Iodidimonas nitroreducens TaxID=1236968 RepID=A0A5A7N9P9_9PROT|nr:hypothetical protein JCM17846_27650 [Iodidimonas nitroreducens]
MIIKEMTGPENGGLFRKALRRNKGKNDAESRFHRAVMRDDDLVMPLKALSGSPICD